MKRRTLRPRSRLIDNSEFDCPSNTEELKAEFDPEATNNSAIRMYANLSRAEISRSRKITGKLTENFIKNAKVDILDFEQALRKMQNLKSNELGDSSAMTTTASLSDKYKYPKIEKMRTVDGQSLPQPFRRNLESHPKFEEIMSLSYTAPTSKDTKPASREGRPTRAPKLTHTEERDRKKTYLKSQMSFIKSTRTTLFVQKEVFEHLNSTAVTPRERGADKAAFLPLEKMQSRMDQFSRGLDFSLSTLKHGQVVQAMRKLRAIPQPPLKLSLNHMMLKKSERVRNFNLIMKNSIQPTVCNPKPALEVSMGRESKSEGSKTRKATVKTVTRARTKTVTAELGRTECVRSARPLHSTDDPSSVVPEKQMFNQNTPPRAKHVSFSHGSGNQIPGSDVSGSRTQRRSINKNEQWSIQLHQMRNYSSRTTPNMIETVELTDANANLTEIRLIDVKADQIMILPAGAENSNNMNPNPSEDSVSLPIDRYYSRHSHQGSPKFPTHFAEKSVSKQSRTEESQDYNSENRMMHKISRLSKSSQSQDQGYKLMTETHKQSLQLRQMIDDVVLNKGRSPGSTHSRRTGSHPKASKPAPKQGTDDGVSPFTLNDPLQL